MQDSSSDDRGGLSGGRKVGTLSRKKEPVSGTWGFQAVILELFQKVVESLRSGTLLEEADHKEQALMFFKVSPLPVH